MASQSLGSALDALVTLIAGVAGVGGCARGPLGTNQIPTGQLPFIQIIEGGNAASHAITSTTQLRQPVLMQLSYNSTRTSENEAIAIYEAVIDALNADLSLGDTCISCIAGDSDPPLMFPTKGGGLHHRGFYAELTYWRDM